MKKSKILIGLLLSVAMLAFGIFGFGCAPEKKTEPDQSAKVTMKYSENKFVKKTPAELAAISFDTWQKKEADGEVVYFFEGQYTEGFSTILDPCYCDLYLCKDGSVFGTNSGLATSTCDIPTKLYGYWYNVDENGEENFTINLTALWIDREPEAVEFGKYGIARVDIFDTVHGSYDKQGGITYPFGRKMNDGTMNYKTTRTISIYGQPYAKATSLTVDASSLGAVKVGEQFNPELLKVSAVRADGKNEPIHGERVKYTGFDSSTPGTKTVTAYFLGASTTFQVTVEAAA